MCALHAVFMPPQTGCGRAARREARRLSFRGLPLRVYGGRNARAYPQTATEVHAQRATEEFT